MTTLDWPDGVIARFWSKVDGGDFLTCWLWSGSVSANGYGHFTVGKGPGSQLLLHRFAYQLLIGEIPLGLQIDHLCRVRRCVNPWHLEPVTPKVNTLRGLTAPALNAAKTHCPVGHAYDKRNTCYKKDGKRSCRRCGAIYAARKRGAA